MLFFWFLCSLCFCVLLALVFSLLLCSFALIINMFSIAIIITVIDNVTITLITDIIIMITVIVNTINIILIIITIVIITAAINTFTIVLPSTTSLSQGFSKKDKITPVTHPTAMTVLTNHYQNRFKKPVAVVDYVVAVDFV